MSKALSSGSRGRAAFGHQAGVRLPAVLCFAAALLFFVNVSGAYAKRLAYGNDVSGTLSDDADDGVYGLSPAEIEARFRPFFEERANSRRGANRQRDQGRPGRRPSNRDYMAIMRAWDRLSAEFRAIYAEAADIYPEDYQEYYISPMGKFKIFYSTTGTDAVNPLVDTIGYGGGPSEWRTRRPAANGVPDYVDETAFALDSAWSMIIDRFGFREPVNIAAPDDGADDYYSVLIIRLYGGEYGATVPQGSRPVTGGGFPSYIELNSDWSGKEWTSLGFNERPYDAVRITCAHEMLHTSQYAMVWSVNLANLTYGWLEGSAVLMEEIAFPDVNDYLHYTTDYFMTPTRAMLANNSIYMNAILFKYLYEKTNPADSIGFIKAVHDNNFEQRAMSFHSNLERASLEHAGRGWAEVLNGFHAESYFTGGRARRPRLFVSDAELMNTWNPPAAESAAPRTKEAGPYGAAFFRYEPRPDHPDTLTLRISGRRDATIEGKTWAVSAIVIETDGSADIVEIPMDQSGAGGMELAGWKERAGVILAATNASPSRRDITVRSDSADAGNPDTLRPNEPLNIYPNVVKIRSAEPVRFLGNNITEIKIISQEGKLLDHYRENAARRSPRFNVNGDGAIEWLPGPRLSPGVCLVSVSAQNPVSNKKSVLRRKIMLLP